ncbi:MAG: Maf family protein [Pseudomonadota bacterium]
MEKLILASASKARSMILKNAGLQFDIIPANVDEAGLRSSFIEGAEGALAEDDMGDIAQILGVAKAKAVSSDHPGYVIGADQILALGCRVFEKPKTLEEAEETLFLLRGKEHVLYSSVCVARDGDVIWHYGDRAKMKMRNFSPEFVSSYLETCGEQVCQSVGAYQIEGFGIQLFSEIRGDYFTILGLPVLPLLRFLRQSDVIS